ncbi:MAG: ABC transporter substrate-binding protein [Rhodocyclales bacterium GT-UBC]|nr:MAG: ABC transporter substrate-binding protein [Rhodocyclales bacterium GT-UBC]
MNKLNKILRALLLAGAGLLLNSAVQAADPVVLRIGDQNYYNIRASVELSKALEGAPYKVEWAPFQAAAPLAEALEAGAIDIGFLGDSGFLFLAAKSPNAKLIGITRQNPKTVALLVPKNSSAKTIADLKGKKVAYWPGAWSQQLTLGALDKAGLPANHVDFVKLMPLDAANALPGGSIDAFPVWEPYISQQVLKNGARVLFTAEGIIPAQSAIAANAASVASKHAAIEDFLGRLKKARAWVEANIDTYADAWATRAALDRDVSRHWLGQAKLTVLPVDAKATADLQVTADFLVKEKVLPTALDVKKVVDTSFSSVLAR